jgi:glycosyltransferase involved in cell wall biosynthesis
MGAIKLLLLVEDFGIGGLERVVESIFNGLDPTKYEPTIWCLARGGEIAERFFREQKNIRILNIKTYHNPLNILRLVFLIKKENFQIVHSHGYFAATIGRLSAFLAGTPIIIAHVHTTYWDFSKRNLCVEKALSNISSKIICCSNAVRDFIDSTEKIDHRKLVTIYNGVSCTRKHDSKAWENNIDPQEISIVTIASLVENKGHRYLFEALAKVIEAHNHVRLRLVGDGPLKSGLLNYATSLGIEGKTDFLGLKDDVQEILSNADIVVLPSIEREGLGISIIEAMCHGKPVIGTNIGGIPELVEDGVNGFLVKPKISDDLAEKLKVLIDDKGLRGLMGKEGRKRFERKFDVSIMLKKIEDLYRALLIQQGIGISKILFLHNKSNISGGEQSLINLWRNLDGEKFNLSLILPNEGLLSHEARRIGLSVFCYALPQLRLTNLTNILKTFRFLALYCRRNKIGLLHSYTPRNNIMAAVLGKILKIPVIWHERNLVFGSESDISRRFAFLPHRIICNSQAVAERFRKKRGIPSKVKVVLNGVDLEIYRPGKALREIVEKYGIKEKKVVGLISNLGKRKMPEYFIEACPNVLNRMPDTVFLIVGGEFGEGDKGRRDELESKARSLGVENNIVFTGFLPAVCDLIRAFDVGVAVTEKEACSRAILEMMASGKPVVAFDTGGNPELIEDGITGSLVHFGDIEGLAFSIVNLLENDEKRREMGVLARARAETYFDVRKNARKTQAIYSTLIAQPGH